MEWSCHSPSLLTVVVGWWWAGCMRVWGVGWWNRRVCGKDEHLGWHTALAKRVPVLLKFTWWGILGSGMIILVFAPSHPSTRVLVWRQDRLDYILIWTIDVIFEIWIFIIILGVTFTNWTPCLGRNGSPGREWRWNQHTVIWRFDYCLTQIISASEQTTSPANINTNYQLLFIINKTVATLIVPGLSCSCTSWTTSRCQRPPSGTQHSSQHFWCKHTKPDHLIVLTFILVLGPHWRHAQQDEPVQGDQLFTADVPAVYVHTSQSPISLHRYVPSLLSCQWLNRYLRSGSSHQQ